MKLKRVITAAIGFPLLLMFLIFGNKYTMDIFMALVACMATYEYSDCIKKESKNLMWIGYLLSFGIAFLHVIPMEVYSILVIIGLPTIMLILFMHIIVTNMKISFKDVAFSLLGILYICCFTVFVPALYGYSNQTKGELYSAMEDGKFLIWYLFIASWGTDVFAYYIGSKFGKHKFSKVSPNKSVEGCIAGALGSALLACVYTFIIKTAGQAAYNYSTIIIVTIILSAIGQIGDFVASSIKRYFKVKDFSELIPGHGGIIDRIDSVIFMAPYAYLIFTYILNLHVVA